MGVELNGEPDDTTESTRFKNRIEMLSSSMTYEQFHQQWAIESLGLNLSSGDPSAASAALRRLAEEDFVVTAEEALAIQLLNAAPNTTWEAEDAASLNEIDERYCRKELQQLHIQCEQQNDVSQKKLASAMLSASRQFPTLVPLLKHLEPKIDQLRNSISFESPQARKYFEATAKRMWTWPSHRGSQYRKLVLDQGNEADETVERLKTILPEGFKEQTTWAERLELNRYRLSSESDVNPDWCHSAKHVKHVNPFQWKDIRPIFF